MKIKFLPQKVAVEASSGSSVLETARAHKLPISSSCNGMCACAECRVYVVEGEAHVLPPTAKEAALIGDGHFLDNRRLSCQLFCFGDVTVDLSEQVEKLQYQKGITKQFLKKIHKEEVSSVGGVLVEQDEDIKKLSEKDLPPLVDSANSVLSDDFYNTTSRRGGRGFKKSGSRGPERSSSHRPYRAKPAHFGKSPEEGRFSGEKPSSSWGQRRHKRRHHKGRPYRSRSGGRSRGGSSSPAR